MRSLLAVTRLLVVVAALAAIAACGQWGPLFLGDNPPPGVKQEKRDPYKPVPYPPQTPDEEAK
jgi:predicted small lipoprotein YifL